MKYECLNPNRKIYLKKQVKIGFENGVKLVCDFDGVLVDTSKSYPSTIIELIDYYFIEILGLTGSKNQLITFQDIQNFKDTGLFNNDWTLSNFFIKYYLMCGFQCLEPEPQLIFSKQLKQIKFLEVNQVLGLLKKLGEFFQSNGTTISTLLRSKHDESIGLPTTLSIIRNGSKPLLTPIFPQLRGLVNLNLIDNLVYYDLQKPDLLKRMFEELYLGKTLFEKFYGTSSHFKFQKSFLEKEQFIPTQNTLALLDAKCGPITIYSEKPRLQGLYLLEKREFTPYFDITNSIFADELINAAPNGKFGKPCPTIFIDQIQKIRREEQVILYVGDTIADVSLVKKAKHQGLTNVMFVGVLNSAYQPTKLLSKYIEYEADVIITDLNDLPYLFTAKEVNG